jgi:hypothetical protein
MILSEYYSGTYVLKEVTKKIDIDLLNLLINKILKNRNELDDTAKVRRATRHSNFVIITGYASLTETVLRDFIEQFLIECEIKYEIKKIDNDDLLKIKKYLPVISIRTGSQCGGRNEDTSTIDPGVEYLCKSINSFNGIETFSSCEGHIKEHSGTFYVLFTHDNKENLDKFTYELWDGLEKVYEKFPTTPEAHLMFDFGHWPHMKCTYFELRIRYENDEQELVFEAMDYLANLLKDKNNVSTTK